MKKRLTQLGLMLSLLLVASAASAQVDVGPATTAMADAETGVTAVSATMLGVVGAGMAVKWILGFLI